MRTQRDSEWRHARRIGLVLGSISGKACGLLIRRSQVRILPGALAATLCRRMQGRTFWLCGGDCVRPWYPLLRGVSVSPRIRVHRDAAPFKVAYLASSVAA